MIRLRDLMKENSKSIYPYGCVMLYYTFPSMSTIQSLIDEEDIYRTDGEIKHGLEDEPHLTLFYGLHKEVTLEDVTEVLDNYTFYTVKAYNPSLFENPKFDVLKFDIEGDNIHHVNKELRKFPHTSKYPKYNPHLTIGYLKSGTGKKYIDLLNDKDMSEYWLHPQYGVYSQTDGSKTKINILVD